MQLLPETQNIIASQRGDDLSLSLIVRSVRPGETTARGVIAFKLTAEKVSMNALQFE